MKLLNRTGMQSCILTFEPGGKMLYRTLSNLSPGVMFISKEENLENVLLYCLVPDLSLIAALNYYSYGN